MKSTNSHDSKVQSKASGESFAIINDGTNGKIERFGFLLIPDFSLLSFASLVDPLRIANRVSRRILYEWHIFSPNNEPARPSNGISFSPTRTLDDCQDIDTLIVVAGINPTKHSNAAMNAWLRDFSRRGVRIGATSTGSIVLARARLLNGYKSTIHWESLDSFREDYPNIQVSGELFEFDRDRLTCSGGTAGLDMMMHLISLLHGKALAKKVAEQCIHPQIRVAHDLQRMEIPIRLSLDHPKIVDAIGHMETHLEDPLSCSTLADMVGISQRQFERMFLLRLGETPARYYKRMRLERANTLLEQTSMTIFQVGVACGFSSAAHFSTSYEGFFGHTPSATRQRMRSK